MITKRDRQEGFSAAEMLVVVAILGLSIAIGIPLVSEQVRQAEIRGAADQFAIDLKAARMIAVSKHTTIAFVVRPDPTNQYEYQGTNGVPRIIQLPAGVKITSPTSDTTISFLQNGSLAAASTTVMEAGLSGGTKERWTITTSVLGVSSTTRQRVSS